jgi:hypothetical protein
VGELLLSIGTFRRICEKKTVSEGSRTQDGMGSREAPGTTLSWTGRDAMTYLLRECSATLDEHP